MDGICDAFNPSYDDLEPLAHYLDVPYSELENAMSSFDREEIKEKVKRECKLAALPPQEKLVEAYPCFSSEIVDEDVIVTYKERVQERLIKRYMIYGRSHFDVTSSSLEIKPFQALAYKTLFELWNSGETTRTMDSLFFRWYCNGNLLHFIFDIVFRGESVSISRSMWRHLNDACSKDPFLADITQEKYNEFRKFTPSIPTHDFQFSGDKSQREQLGIPEFYPALPKIVRPKPKEGYLTESEMHKLYAELVRNGYLLETETSPEAFVDVFSGEGMKARPIKWHGKQSELAAFLEAAKRGQSRKKDAEKAALLFLKKNGQPCNACTLNQPPKLKDDQADPIETFKTIIKEAIKEATK